MVDHDQKILTELIRESVFELQIFWFITSHVLMSRFDGSRLLTKTSNCQNVNLIWIH